MAQKPKVLILRTAGTNCDQETAFAFKSCGAQVYLRHMNELMRGKVDFKDCHILVLPGGFSYGDDIESGRILANELRLKWGDSLREFINEGKLMMGICNGFQVMVKAGILPGSLKDKNQPFKQMATLVNNDSGRFEDRWIHLKACGKSVWTEGLPKVIYLPVAHGEGKFVPEDKVILDELRQNNQIAFRYAAADGKNPQYPENPNGSVNDIAGITDSTGRVLGLMPHPERNFLFIQHPQWTRFEKKGKWGDGAKIFDNGVKYVKKNLI